MATANRPVSVAQCSFVQRLVLPVKGTVLANALLLADVDSDGENELILGTTDGELLIFKHAHTLPCFVAGNVGTIACLAVGTCCCISLQYF
jgi:hypothetical protein